MRLHDLDSVVRHGLCAGCGICESMLGRDNVEMRLTSFGQIRPRVKKPVDRARMDEVLSVSLAPRLPGHRRLPRARMA